MNAGTTTMPTIIATAGSAIDDKSGKFGYVVKTRFALKYTHIRFYR